MSVTVIKQSNINWSFIPNDRKYFTKKKILTYKTFSIISIHDIVIPALLVNKYATLDDKNNKLNNFTTP